MNSLGRLELALPDGELAPPARRRGYVLAAITLGVALLSFAAGLAAR